MPRATFSTAPDGTAYRDLNRNGLMDRYEDPRLSVQDRVEDLLGRLSLPEKIGLLFQTVIEAGPDGAVLEGPGAISKSATTQVVAGKLVNHFNVHVLSDARAAARWHNAVQAIAETTPHGIPVTISTDPRHSFAENSGASFSAGPFSQWPEMLGLAALRDPERVREFATIARQEYVAVGIRAALHPTLDLATEPRWARQAQTFGQDPALVSALGVAYVEGFQGEALGPGGVACCAKHFPGGGAQQDGEDAHFPYGKEQVYPSGSQDAHLEPFPAVIDAGVAAVMPYYSMPIGLELDGVAIDPVGFAYNRQIVTDLLRGTLGFDGVVLSDWELINDNLVGDQVLPARAWGVEHLDPLERAELLLAAGCDQFGGEECVEVVAELVAAGRVSEARIDESARRLLAVKFRLGLFDDPYVDEDAAVAVVGRADFRAAGLRAQAESVVVLTDRGSLLPLDRTRGSARNPHDRTRGSAREPHDRTRGSARAPDDRTRGSARAPDDRTRGSAGPDGPATTRRVYVEGLAPDVAARLGEVVARPEDADLAIVRISAPFEPRSDLFLEAFFHQGSLDFPPGLPVRLARIARHCPLVVDVFLDRPAVLTPLVDVATVLTASFGTSDHAYVDALTGAVPPLGRLPFDIPRSMADVRAHPVDQPGFDDPLFASGYRLE